MCVCVCVRVLCVWVVGIFMCVCVLCACVCVCVILEHLSPRRWDTARENDGGAVFDPSIRKFLTQSRPAPPRCVTLTVSNPATFGPLRK